MRTMLAPDHHAAHQINFYFKDSCSAATIAYANENKKLYKTGINLSDSLLTATCNIRNSGWQTSYQRGTVKNSWPLKRINAVLQDVWGARALPALHITSRYWQHPMYPGAQLFHAIMTMNNVVHASSTKTVSVLPRPAKAFVVNHASVIFDQIRSSGGTPSLFLIIPWSICSAEWMRLCALQRSIVLSFRRLHPHSLREYYIPWPTDGLFGKTLYTSKQNVFENACKPEAASELCRYVHSIAKIESFVPCFA